MFIFRWTIHLNVFRGLTFASCKHIYNELKVIWHSHWNVLLEVSTCLSVSEWRWEEGGSMAMKSKGHSTALLPLHYQHQMMATLHHKRPQKKEKIPSARHLLWQLVSSLRSYWFTYWLSCRGRCWGFKARWLLIPKSCSTTQFVHVNRAIAHPYTQSLVQYICGLGSRKGSHLLKVRRSSKISILTFGLQAVFYLSS